MIKKIIVKLMTLTNTNFLFVRYLSKKKFQSQFKEFYVLSQDNRFKLNWDDRYPCLDDNTAATGYDRHYIYHPAWAARVLAEIKPTKHVDISSILYFSSMLSAFIPVEFYDFRPADLKLTNLVSKPANLLNLPFDNNCVESLSCMHVVEHIGLGRYGDPIDPDGDIKAINELKRVLAINGSLLFVVPVGKPKIQFNAHRIYSYEQIIELFADLKLVQFALIPENFEHGGLNVDADAINVSAQNYGCGCFWFRKIG